MNKSTLLIIALMLITITACTTTQKGTIRIGASLPMTGPIAQFGEWESKGINLALDEINSNGGINERNWN